MPRNKSSSKPKKSKNNSNGTFVAVSFSGSDKYILNYEIPNMIGDYSSSMNKGGPNWDYSSDVFHNILLKK